MPNVKPSFRWTCSYMGEVSFMFSDDTGTYEVRLRTRLDDYERSVLRPESVKEAELTIGYLVRSGKPIPAETVRAFNEWRLAECAQWNRTFDAEPERYGHVGPNDPLRAPTLLAKGSAHWQAPAEWSSYEELSAKGQWVFSPLSDCVQTAA